MKERTNGKAALVAALLVFSAVSSAIAVASLNISPVRIELSDDHDKDVITITNHESSAKSYEVEVVAWSQTDDRREVYEPTEDLVAVPPLFTLNPGEEQLIRVGMLTTADPLIEKSYRLFITEIASPESIESPTTGVRMRLKIGVPVFIAPIAMPSVNLTYVTSSKVGDTNFLRFRNDGNTHVKITETRYVAPGTGNETVTPAVGYLLPGQSGLLPVDLPNGDQVGTIKIVTENLGAMEYELPLAP